MSKEKYENLKRVAIESPFAGDVKTNIAYAKACVNDCLKRGEAPYASHLFFTQDGILDDTVPDERMLGIMAGKAWEKAAAYTAVYIDRGISGGMTLGIKICAEMGRPVVYRSLGEGWLTDEGKEVLETVEVSV